MMAIRRAPAPAQAMKNASTQPHRYETSAARSTEATTAQPTEVTERAPWRRYFMPGAEATECAKRAMPWRSPLRDSRRFARAEAKDERFSARLPEECLPTITHLYSILQRYAHCQALTAGAGTEDSARAITPCAVAPEKAASGSTTIRCAHTGAASALMSSGRTKWRP